MSGKHHSNKSSSRTADTTKGLRKEDAAFKIILHLLDPSRLRNMPVYSNMHLSAVSSFPSFKGMGSI